LSLSSIAQETLQILDRGYYETDSGRVDISEAQQKAVTGTLLLRPDDLEKSAFKPNSKTRKQKTTFSLTKEKTQEAACRLVREEGLENLAVLNFASARNPGGGFLRGARAQEEDLARSSGLYRCLEAAPDYYRENNEFPTSLYTDNIIYSPKVPWFRVWENTLFHHPFLASIITSPAPNAGEYFRKSAGNAKTLRETLARRAGYILAAAEIGGNDSVLLGAWGCGVFRNDSNEVANAFMSHLKSRRFRNSFSRVVFAVYDPSDSQETYLAFKAVI